MSARTSFGIEAPLVFDELQTARIMCVDDDEDNLALLEISFREAGAPNVKCVSNPLIAGEVYREFEPDVVLIDLRMPPIDGFILMEQFREIDGPDRMVPIIMLTGDATLHSKRRALEAGVADFLSKGFDLTELLLRVRNCIRTQYLYRQTQRQKGWLEETVRIRTRQLFAARREVLERLALAAEYRDDQTGEHTRRVGHLSAQIAQKVQGDPLFVESIGAAALLHDLGKIGIPDEILLKKGALDHFEYELMKEHTRIGARILSDCTEPVMRMAQEIALTHHEWWNGHGYPNGLSGTDIPLSGRIVSVADAFDAMTSKRPYKDPMPIESAVHEIVACQGRQFDPDVVNAFVDVVFRNESNILSEYTNLVQRSPSQPRLGLDD